MKKQQSQLSITSEVITEHDKTADEIVFKNVHNGKGKSIFSKWIIPKELKTDFLKQLQYIGIDSSQIYPDKDFYDGIDADLESFILGFLE